MIDHFNKTNNLPTTTRVVRLSSVLGTTAGGSHAVVVVPEDHSDDRKPPALDLDFEVEAPASSEEESSSDFSIL